MLSGKIIHDGHDYSVKVGSVTVDITQEVHDLIALACRDRSRALLQELTELRAKHADIVDRYSQIARIVIAGGAGMPTG